MDGGRERLFAEAVHGATRGNLQQQYKHTDYNDDRAHANAVADNKLATNLANAVDQNIEVTALHHIEVVTSFT